MRTWIEAAIFGLFLSAYSSPVAAQNNPVPFVSNPTFPAAALPGGSQFTLTVNGAGFVDGAVVRWDGSARATTVVSPIKATAVIPASDISVAATVFVTVSNPGPGGGISNPVFFEVTTPATSLAFTRTDSDFPHDSSSTIAEPRALAVLDLTNTGIPYLAIANGICPIELQCSLEKASISIASEGSTLSDQAYTGASPFSIGIGDFNGDGLLDLITAGPLNFSILFNTAIPGNDFAPHKDYPLPAGCNAPFALGDFNGDGHLDLVLAGSSGICILLGKGDGTFGGSASFDSGTLTGAFAVGDFNGDGKLDLALANPFASTISILLGNGDGTFQAPVDYSTGPLPNFVVTGDFKGDGRLDLAVVNNTDVSIFLGNGDGTFKSRVDYSAGANIQSLTVGDYNGDGVLDLAVADSLCITSTCPANGSVNVLLGNGDGTFQSHLDFSTGGQPVSIATADFEYGGKLGGPAGRPGFATANEQDNDVSVFVAIPTGSVNSVPTISSIAPSSALVNSGAFTLTVNGTNFISSSTVYFAGQPRVTTFVSVTQITADIQANDVGSTGAVSVLVANPAPGGGDSTSSTFNVYGPPPAISSLSPSSVVAGSPAFTLMVNGLNFVNGAAVNFNGAPQPTTFVSSTQLTLEISAGDIANPSTINISVTDPVGNGSGGGTSSTLPLTILPTSTQPVVGALVPASATAGGAAFTLTLTGSGFTTSSVVSFNSNVVSSAFVSATQLQAAIPASAIAVAGSPFVTVANPGGPASVVVTFTVNNPVPAASSLSPSSVSAGNPAVTLDVMGTNFNASSIILVGGSVRATTFMSPTSLNAALPAGDFAHSGTLNVTVNNPAPGGGTTSILTIVVEDFTVKVQTPAASVPAGQPANFDLIVVPANAATANAVSFVALGLPAGATASFSPSSTIPAASGNTPVMLSIGTTAHSAASLPVSPASPKQSWPIWALWIVAFGAIGRNRLRVMRGRAEFLAPRFVLSSLLLMAAGFAACGSLGGGGSPPTQPLNPQSGTPAGTYLIVVTATSGGGSLSTTVTLTVM